MKKRKRSAPHVRRLERQLAGELQALVRRLRKAAARTRPVRRKYSCPALPVLEVRRADGLPGGRLVHGTVCHPGSAEPVRHSWIEAGDQVHDPTLGEGRRIWPRELYYLVFRAIPARAAATRAA